MSFNNLYLLISTFLKFFKIKKLHSKKERSLSTNAAHNSIAIIATKTILKKTQLPIQLSKPKLFHSSSVNNGYKDKFKNLWGEATGLFDEMKRLNNGKLPNFYDWKKFDRYRELEKDWIQLLNKLLNKDFQDINQFRNSILDENGDLSEEKIQIHINTINNNNLGDEIEFEFYNLLALIDSIKSNFILSDLDLPDVLDKWKKINSVITKNLPTHLNSDTDNLEEDINDPNLKPSTFNVINNLLKNKPEGFFNSTSEKDKIINKFLFKNNKEQTQQKEIEKSNKDDSNNDNSNNDSAGSGDADAGD